MRDPVSIGRVALLHPAIAREVRETIEQVEQGFPENLAVRVVQGLRTFEQQNELYQIGRAAKGVKVTNARAGQSFHNYGLALDYAILVDKNGDGKYDELSWDINKDADGDKKSEWSEVADAFILKGYGWGGAWRTFKDYPHLEKTFGYTWKDLLIKYNNHEFIENTKYVQL